VSSASSSLLDLLAIILPSSSPRARDDILVMDELNRRGWHLMKEGGQLLTSIIGNEFYGSLLQFMSNGREQGA